MFVCLEPGVIIPSHRNNKKNTLRCVIPLIIPTGNNGINIDGENIKFDQISKNNNFVIFDENYSNYMWNNTNSNLFILFIEISK